MRESGCQIDARCGWRNSIPIDLRDVEHPGRSARTCASRDHRPSAGCGASFGVHSPYLTMSDAFSPARTWQPISSNCLYVAQELMLELLVVGIDLQRQHIVAAIRFVGRGIARYRERRAGPVPRHRPLAGTGFDRGDDLVGHGLVDIETRFLHGHGMSPSLSSLSARHGRRGSGLYRRRAPRTSARSERKWRRERSDLARRRCPLQ